MEDAEELETQNDKEISFAEQEFINWCDANEIDHTEEDMEEEDRKDFQKIKKRFMRAVNAQRLVVDGTKLVYTISKFSETSGQKLTISRPTGRDFIAMDGFKETQQMMKFHAFIASIAKTEKSFVARLDMVDRQFLQDIGTLFLVG
jgi:hypothetical protein